jgi:hypothetical protein
MLCQIIPRPSILRMTSGGPSRGACCTTTPSTPSTGRQGCSSCVRSTTIADSPHHRRSGVDIGRLHHVGRYLATDAPADRHFRQRTARAPPRTRHHRPPHRQPMAVYWRSRGKANGDRTTRLKVYGIRARLARNTALMDLANQLPTVVISRLLGLHIRTATRWSAEAGHSRADYAAGLASQLEQSP